MSGWELCRPAEAGRPRACERVALRERSRRLRPSDGGAKPCPSGRNRYHLHTAPLRWHRNHPVAQAKVTELEMS